jgi:hypothetical protein
MRPACPSTSHAEINLHYAYIYAECIIFFGHGRHFLFLSSLTSQLWFAHRELRTVRGWPCVKWGGELNAAKDDLPERRRRPAGRQARVADRVGFIECLCVWCWSRQVCPWLRFALLSRQAFFTWHQPQVWSFWLDITVLWLFFWENLPEQAFIAVLW